MTETQSPKPIRWKILSIWLLILSAVELYFYLKYGGVFNPEQQDKTLQGFALLVYIITAGISILIWWVFISGVPLKRKLQGVGVLVVACLLFRIDGFTGNTLPIIRFIWTPKAGSLTKEVQSGQDSAKYSFEGYELTDTDWPDFRGVGRMGMVSGLNFQDQWLTPNELWRIPIGAGWASFAAVRDLCWTMEQVGEKEAISAFELKTGNKIWQKSYDAHFKESFGGPGPRTNPVYQEGRIWALGASGLLSCLDAVTGKEFWQTNILKDADAENIEWGMSATPLLYQDLIITLPGGANGKSLVAYDKMTGEVRWSGGNSIASYSSPQISTVDGVEQILVHNGVGISAHSTEDGSVLWDYPWTTASKVNVAQPIVFDGNKVILSTGYTVGSISLEASLKEGKWSVKEKWKSRRLKAKFNASVYKGQYLYGLDEGILTCINMEDGQRVWKGGRYGYGQMILVGDTILILSDKGEVVFVKAIPDQHSEIGKFPVFNSKTWQHPIIANGHLVVRNDREAACFLLK